jgi:3'-5' exoribonuclease-like protein
MRYFFDTEFLDNGREIDLISIGIVAEDGREYYAVSANFDVGRATPWLVEHVLNHIPRNLVKQTKIAIACDVSDFLAPKATLEYPGTESVELWGWYCAYDWVALCQLYGPMVERPRYFPKLAYDIRLLAALSNTGKISKSGFTRHNALEDARWNKFAFETAARKYDEQTRGLKFNA